MIYDLTATFSNYMYGSKSIVSLSHAAWYRNSTNLLDKYLFRKKVAKYRLNVQVTLA